MVTTIAIRSEVLVTWILLWPLLRVKDLVVAFLLREVEPTYRINFVLHNRWRIIEDEPLLIQGTILLNRAHDGISSRIIDERIVELYLQPEISTGLVIGKIKCLPSVETNGLVSNIDRLLMLQLGLFDGLCGSSRWKDKKMD